jgi:site-specific DNA-methyltransferase (adenine-specific)
VLDPFMGSGTSAVAARKLGLRSIGIELSEGSVKIIVDRLAQQSLFA